MIDEVGKIGEKKKQETAGIANYTPRMEMQQPNKMEPKKEEISKINETDRVNFSSEVMNGEA